MHTISEITADIDRGCTANNLNTDMFRYRIIFFVNEGANGSKHYKDSAYSDMRKSLEDIIRSHLSLTNNIVIAETTVLKDGKPITLQSRSYSFCLDEYFRQIKGEGSIRKRSRAMYGRYAVRV